MKPGITEVLFHASVPTDDFPRVTGSWQSRRGDTEALTSPVVRQAILELGIRQTTWAELMKRRRAAPKM